jgi:hypothetical protein
MKHQTLLVIAPALLLVNSLGAEMPYTTQGPPADPYDYAAYLFIDDGQNDLPATFDYQDTWWLTDYRGDEASIVYNPQELFGVRGMGVNRAWQVSTGRPDVTIAILDSGILWNTQRCELLRKLYLNRHELPLPETGPNPDDSRFDGYDVNGDGVFNVEDYWADSRVSDLNGNSWIDPEDLILVFSDGVDGDDNGYTDDISGWDFYENDNDPQDDVDHGHGSNQSGHAAAEAFVAGEVCSGNPSVSINKPPGTCPSCMIMPLRVGDSFIADANHFAEAVVYAVDNGVQVVETALGTLNHTSFGQQAVDYAYRNGVIVNASEADEASGHHNWPAGYEHAVVHNSVRPSKVPATQPESYIYLNGCTNFGAYTHITIPSSGCSSQATGLASGVSGLLASAALSSVERGDMTPYIRDDGSTADYPLAAEEMRQLWRLAGDDIDFSTDYPYHAFSELWDDYRPWWWVGSPDGGWNDYDLIFSIIDTRRYQTVRGWDYFTGYGRLNAARLIRFIGREEDDGTSLEYLAGDGPYGVGHDPLLSAQDRIPPEADIVWPRRWHQYGYRSAHHLLLPDDPDSPQQIVVRGRVAANRVTSIGGTFDYVLEWAAGAQGPPSPDGLTMAAPDSEETSAGPWYEVSRVTGLAGAYSGELGRIELADITAVQAETEYPFAMEGDPIGPRPTEQWAVRLRLRVLAHPINANDIVNNEAVHLKQIDVYPAPELVLRDDLGVDGQVTGGTGSPSFSDIDGDGRDELLLPTDDGLVHAFTNLATGEELPGWPVSTMPLAGLPASGDNAYTRGDISSSVPSSILFGTVAVADLDDDGVVEVLAGDSDGWIYAWQPDGQLRHGFPVSVDFSLSRETACGPASIPVCDDYGATDLRGPVNRRDWAFHSAPAVADLDPNTAGLEVIAGSADSHIYAWHADGTPVSGWPVVLRDPVKVATMDHATRTFTLDLDSGWQPGSKVTQTPSLGDIDGDGLLEVVATVNEEYSETPNADLDDTFLETVLEYVGQSGNGRVYALHHTGADSPVNAQAAASAHTQDQAYLSGWPAPIAITKLDLLPNAGQGSNGQPPLADIDGNGTIEAIVASHYGPGYILNHDGSSFLGLEDGFYRTLRREDGDFGTSSAADDDISLPALGGMAVGAMTADRHLSIATGCAGINRMLDNALAGRQEGAEDHLGLWDARDGQYEANGPLIINDLQFFTTPLFADITGDGLAEVIQQSSFSDILAASATDTEDTIQVFHTGGWQISTPAVGPAPLGSLDQGTLSIASISREGYLRVLPTMTPGSGEVARQALAEWPEASHDPHNSGSYHTDAIRPYPVSDLHAGEYLGDAMLSFTATGDDRDAGRATSYQVRLLSGVVDEPDWSSATPAAITAAQPALAGEHDTITVTGVELGETYTILVRAYDEAGNGSAPAVTRLTMRGEPRRPRGRRGIAR